MNNKDSSDDEGSSGSDGKGFWGEDGNWYPVSKGHQATKEDHIYGMYSQQPHNSSHARQRRRGNSNYYDLSHQMTTRPKTKTSDGTGHGLGFSLNSFANSNNSPNSNTLNLNFRKGNTMTVNDLDDKSDFIPLPTDTHIDASTQNSNNSNNNSNSNASHSNNNNKNSDTNIVDEEARKRGVVEEYERHMQEHKQSRSNPTQFKMKKSMAAYGVPNQFGASSRAKTKNNNNSINQKKHGFAGFGGLESNQRSGSKNKTQNDNNVFVPVQVGQSFGNWNSSKFGAKYLSKFGFRGRLGKNEQGIAEPVQVHLRKQGAGLGSIREVASKQPKNAEQQLQYMEKELHEKKAKKS